MTRPTKRTSLAHIRAAERAAAREQTRIRAWLARVQWGIDNPLVRLNAAGVRDHWIRAGVRALMDGADGHAMAAFRRAVSSECADPATAGAGD